MSEHKNNFKSCSSFYFTSTAATTSNKVNITSENNLIS